MAFVQWDQKLSVGINQIDMQHKKLVSMVNEMYEAMSQGKGNDVVGKVLDDLITYTRTHFATEEKLMQANGYPDYAAHKALHDQLTKQAGQMQADFKSGKAALSTKVAAFLKDWLVNHIMGTDQKYAPFLQGKGVK
jgi:hemerythrin